MKPITVIIPTWNFGRYLEPLYNSFIDTDFGKLIEEVIFVCDKSEDNSEEIIRGIIKDQAARGRKVRLIVPEQRKGLFFARYLGATAAQTEKIMFIDSRITISPSSGQALASLIPQYGAMSSVVDIDVSKNIFCLYWQRSHETVFAKTYRDNKALLEVNSQNFDDYRIGGTCFFCNRELFVKVSSKYLNTGLKSDDTFVMKEMVQSEPFYVHPDFRILWEPRDEWVSFVKHLYHRGPGFAEYHLFERRGWLFYAVLTGGIGLIGVLILLFIHPLWAVGLFLAGLLGMALSTFWISKSISEAIRLMPLHVAVLLAYGFGALRGAWVIYKKRRSPQWITQKI